MRAGTDSELTSDLIILFSETRYKRLLPIDALFDGFLLQKNPSDIFRIFLEANHWGLESTGASDH